MSFLVMSEILELFINTLTGDASILFIIVGIYGK